MAQQEAGLTYNNVEEIVRAATAAIPEAERITREVVKSTPLKSAPPNWTRSRTFTLRFTLDL